VFDNIFFMIDFNKFIANLGFTPSKIYPSYCYFNGKEHEFIVDKDYELCFFQIKKPIKNDDIGHTIEVAINGEVLKDFIIHDSTYNDFSPWLSTWCYAPIVPLDYHQYGMLDVSAHKIKTIKFDQDVECLLIQKGQIESTNPEMEKRWRRFA
jgi:hypothetical protein